MVILVTGGARSGKSQFAQSLFAENERVASRIALESGNDMMMNAPEFYENMISLVKSGEVDETLIDEAVMRI